MSMAAVLPLLIAGGAAAVVATHGKKTKRKISKNPCNVLDELHRRGPGVWLGSLSVARKKINNLPPVKIADNRVYSYTARLADGKTVNSELIVRSNYPQILRYAKEVFKSVCNKYPDIELIYETRDELLKHIGESYGDGMGGSAELISGQIPDKWLRNVSIRRGSMTPEEREAFGWICMATTEIVTGSQDNSPVYPYDYLDDFDSADDPGYKYLSDNGSPLVKPSSVFSSESIDFLTESNKKFDRELSRYLDLAMEFYLNFKSDRMVLAANGVRIDDQLSTSLTHLACSKFINDKFNKKNCTNDAILNAVSLILEYDKKEECIIEDLTETSDYPPVLFIRYNDKAFGNAVDIAVNMYAAASGEADVLLISRAALIATSSPGKSKINDQFAMAMEYYDRMASGDFDFPSFLNYASYKNENDMTSAYNRSVTHEPIALNLLERIMSAVTQRVSNLKFG